MWLRLFLLGASTLLVSGTLDLGFFQSRHYVPPPAKHMNCYEYSRLDTHRFGRSYNEEWRTHKPVMRTKMFSVPQPTHTMSRRIDKLFPKEDDLVKEHAKLVQDINSLKQVVYITPFDDSRDVQYDDTIIPELIETSPTSSPKPVTFKTHRPIKISTPRPTSFPIIYLGGESTRQVVRSQPLIFQKSVSLVGTTSSPLLKHPYPFVMQASSIKPFRVCMSPLPPYPATTKRPSLWERLINSILPKTG